MVVVICISDGQGVDAHMQAQQAQSKQAERDTTSLQGRKEGNQRCMARVLCPGPAPAGPVLSWVPGPWIGLEPGLGLGVSIRTVQCRPSRRETGEPK